MIMIMMMMSSNLIDFFSNKLASNIVRDFFDTTGYR
jgi:hypothetical protein